MKAMLWVAGIIGFAAICVLSWIGIQKAVAKQNDEFPVTRDEEVVLGV